MTTNIFYPHILKISLANTDQEYSPVFRYYSKCKYISTPAICIPKHLPPIPIGTKIKVFDLEGETLFAGVVKEFKNDFFHNKILVS